MFRKFLQLIFFTVLFIFPFFLSPQLIGAQEIKQVTIVNPIRGNDFWSYNHNILDTPKKQYEIISKNNLAATWLVRYDALTKTEVVAFLKSLNSSQEIGLFLEITPSLAKDAGVKYNPSPNWHFAKSVFLIGYSLDDRKKIIDQIMEVYKDKFGNYPKSVGAWWVDAYSLNYLHDKYDVTSNLDVADQYSTDQYSVWGQYFSTPFYPSKVNALMPAQSIQQKIGVVTTQWAARDPFNSYGNGVGESTYSVQANDYLLHKLNINYFEKLINIYPQVTIGLENDFDWKDLGREYQNQIELLALKQKSGILQIKTMSEFSKYYQNRYPDISPNVLIFANDSLGGDWKAVWYLTPKYRVGLFYGPFGVAIRDLREFNDSIQESCFKSACDQLNLAFTQTQAIDDVNFSTRWVIDEGKITEFKVNKTGNQVEIDYKNQAGTLRKIKFLPNDIEVDGKIQTIATAILNTVNTAQTEVQKTGNVETKFIFGKNLPKIATGFFKFLILVIFFFFIPGWVISRKLLLSIPIGWSVFALVSFFIGFLHLDILIWLIPVISLIVLIKVGLPKLERPKINIENIFLFATVSLGSLTWLLTNVKNGLLYSYGLGYWGPNGHDAIWHLALISELQRNFPPQNPVFAGSKLLNYHYFYDLLIAKSAALFQISNQDLLFRFFPLLISVILGFLMWNVTKKIFKDFNEKFKLKVALLSVLFMYFGGSLGWIISFLKDKSFGGESTFWAQQAISTLLNPPFAISLVLFLAGLYLFLEIQGKEKFNLSLISLIILWGSLVEFKVYVGVLVLGGLGLLTIEKIIFKKNFQLLKIFIPAVILSLIVFSPNNIGSTSLVVFMPFWLIQSMIEFPDRLGWQRLNLAIRSGVLYKIILGNLLGLLVFLIGNLSTRAFGFFNIRVFFEQRLLFYMALIGLILPLIFIQKGNDWNIIQFFYYTIFIFNIFAAFTVARIWQRLGPRIGLIFVFIIVVLTIPTSINALDQYLPARPPARLSVEEKEALDYLKNEPAGVVLTLLFDPNLKKKYLEPVPLAAYTSTAYVSAFSNHPTFLEDTINLEILGVDYKGRLNLERDFVNIKEKSKEILKDNNISYLYILKSADFNEDEGVMGIKRIFENKEVKIFKVI